MPPLSRKSLQSGLPQPDKPAPSASSGEPGGFQVSVAPGHFFGWAGNAAPSHRPAACCPPRGEKHMTPAELERISSYLYETRENLLSTARGLSPTQLQYKSAPDRWSVAECLEHITVTEGFILANIHNTLQQAAESPTPGIGDDGIVQMVPDRSTRVKGPERLMPTARWAHARLLSEFESARKRTADFAATTDAPLRQHGFAHPLLGP